MEEISKTLINNIRWLLDNDQLDDASTCIEQAQGVLVEQEIWVLKIELLIRKQRFSEARQMLELSLAKYPVCQDLLELSLYLANEIEGNHKECRRIGNLFHLLKGEEVLSLESDKNSKNHMRILHGTIEIANQMNILTKVLQKNGYETKGINYYPSYLKYGDATPNFILSSCTQEELNMNVKLYAAQQIAENDIFHFHFGTTLTFDYSDLPVLSNQKKRRLMHFWGSEVRRLSIARKFNPYVKVKDTDEISILQKLEFLSQYIDECIVCDQELALYVKEFFKKVHILPLAMDIEKYKPAKPISTKDKISIVHAPTHFGIKGTNVIMQVMDRLSKDFPIEFKLVQGMTHEEAKKIYEQADLVIDQILIGCYGVFALECMAMGKPVVTWISDFMKNQYPTDLPIISANPHTLEHVLRTTLSEPDILPELGRRSRIYVEKYHDARVIGKKLLGIYHALV